MSDNGVEFTAKLADDIRINNRAGLGLRLSKLRIKALGNEFEELATNVYPDNLSDSRPSGKAVFYSNCLPSCGYAFNKFMHHPDCENY